MQDSNARISCQQWSTPQRPTTGFFCPLCKLMHQQLKVTFMRLLGHVRLSWLGWQESLLAGSSLLYNFPISGCGSWGPPNPRSSRRWNFEISTTRHGVINWEEFSEKFGGSFCTTEAQQCPENFAQNFAQFSPCHCSFALDNVCEYSRESASTITVMNRTSRWTPILDFTMVVVLLSLQKGHQAP